MEHSFIELSPSDPTVFFRQKAILREKSVAENIYSMMNSHGDRENLVFLASLLGGVHLTQLQLLRVYTVSVFSFYGCDSARVQYLHNNEQTTSVKSTTTCKTQTTHRR